MRAKKTGSKLAKSLGKKPQKQKGLISEKIRKKDKKAKRKRGFDTPPRRWMASDQTIASKDSRRK